MLRIVPPTVPRVSRSDEHFPDGFELHLLQVLPDVYHGVVQHGGVQDAADSVAQDLRELYEWTHAATGTGSA